MKLNIEELKLILLNDSLPKIEIALDNFEIGCFDNYGNNILHHYVKNHEAVQMPAESIIQLFIDFGIDISASQSNMPKRTSSQLAVITQSKQVFKILLTKGADVDIKDGNGKVALSDAVFGYRGDDGFFIETLIANGANVNVMNNYGVSPKSLAETMANYDTRKFFT